jgi:hypothetical protein
MLYGNTKVLRETNGDLRARLGDVEAKLAEETLRHEVTRADLAALGRVVTGEAHWVAIEDQLGTHHKAVTTRLDRIVKLVHEIIDALRKRPD